MTELLTGMVRASSRGDAQQLADEPGNKFILGMADEDYFARSELSASGLKPLLVSPKLFQYERTARTVKSAFPLGHAVHALVLGVGLPIVMIPQKLLSGVNNAIQSNEAKQWVKDAETAGKTALKPEAFETTKRASDAVLKHPKAGPLFARAGWSEVTGVAVDPDTGQRLRGRVDRLDEDGLLLDLKTAERLSDQAIRRQIEDYHYDMSMEMYRFLFELVTGAVARPTILVFIEKKPPYDVVTVELDDLWIEGGWMKLRRTLQRFVECNDARQWPGVDETGDVRKLDPSPWYAAEVARSQNSLEG